MTRFIQEGPMWRRAVAAAIAMVGVSAVFVAAVLLVLGSLVDLAVAPTPDTKADTDVQTSDGTSAPRTKEARDPSKGGDTSEEQS
jgi:hypothetical protein